MLDDVVSQKTIEELLKKKFNISYEQWKGNDIIDFTGLRIKSSNAIIASQNFIRNANDVSSVSLREISCIIPSSFSLIFAFLSIVLYLTLF